MSSNAIASQGTLLKMGDGGGPETFTTIGEVHDITGPDGKRKQIPVTPIDQTRASKISSALLDWGTVTFKVGLVPGSATHGKTTGLYAKFINNTKTNFKLIFTNDSAGSATWAFAANVSNIKPSAGDDNYLMADVTLEITDDITMGGS